MENNKIGAQFICLEDESFYHLIETLYERLKDKDKGEKWLTAEQVKVRLNISSPTTLQKLRDQGELRISQLSKKLIMYDRDSVDDYLERHARKPIKSWR